MNFKWAVIYSGLLLWTTMTQANISEMLVKPVDIGPDWEGGTGVVIEDLQNPPAFFAQSMAETIEQFKSVGVKGMANLAYRKKTNAMHQVELKLFEFESQAAAQAWQAKKYGYPDWEAHYVFSKDRSTAIFDSKQINKRIIFFKNYWITASTITDTGDHLLVLKIAIQKINNGLEN